MYQNIPPKLHTYSNVELRNPYISFDPATVLPNDIPEGYTPYNVNLLRQNNDIYQSIQQAHNNAFPPPPKFDFDPANTLPKLEPMFYQQHPNFNYLNNPTPFNQNYDYQIQNKYINGSLTNSEGAETRSTIMNGLANYRLNLGPVFF